MPLFRGELQEAALLTDTVDHFMKAPVRVLGPNVSVIEALQLAEDAGVHHLPIVENGEIMGLVCTCDLEDVDLKLPVRHIPRGPAATIARGASVGDAVLSMAQRGIGSLLVTEGNQVVGIVTREDLSKAGVEVDDTPGFRCVSCGSVKHLKSEGDKGTLCLDCRVRSRPETPDDGTGVGD
jgi:CBS domain-containing protein